MKTLITFITYSGEEYTIERQDFNKQKFFENIENIKFIELDNGDLENIKNIKSIKFKDTNKVKFTDLL